MSSIEKLVDGAYETVLSSLKQDISVIQTKLPQVAKIESPEDEARASEFCLQIKLRIDKAEDARKFLTAPLNAHIKSINATFKEKTEPLNESLTLIKNGMIKWRHSEEVREAKEAAERAKQEARVAIAQGDIKTVQAAAQDVQEAQQVATQKVRTQTGKTTFRKITKWELKDPLTLPAYYWMPDEKKIAEDVKLGKKIEGVKTWIDEVPIFSL